MSKLFDWMQRQGGKPEPLCLGCNLCSPAMHECTLGLTCEADALICPSFEVPLENPTCADCTGLLYRQGKSDRGEFMCFLRGYIWREPSESAKGCDTYTPEPSAGRERNREYINNEHEIL